MADLLLVAEMSEGAPRIGKVRSAVSRWLIALANKIAPADDDDDEEYWQIERGAWPVGYTPPFSAESNERTKRTKAKRRRQRERLRALENERKLSNRAEP